MRCDRVLFELSSFWYRSGVLKTARTLAKLTLGRIDQILEPRRLMSIFPGHNEKAYPIEMRRDFSRYQRAGLLTEGGALGLGRILAVSSEARPQSWRQTQARFWLVAFSGREGLDRPDTLSWSVKTKP